MCETDATLPTSQTTSSLQTLLDGDLFEMPDVFNSSQRYVRAHASSLVLCASGLAALGWIDFLFRFAQTHKAGAAGLFPADLIFTDFYLYKPTFDAFHTADFFVATASHSRFAYPPVVAALYRFFYSHHHRIAWYLLSTVLLWSALLAWVVRLGRQVNPDARGKIAMICSVALCYPAVFLLERGNLELFVWASVAAGVFLFVERKQTMAAACFGLAAALKLYPVLLLGLFFRERNGLRSIVSGVAVMLGTTLWALWYAGPSIGFAAHGFWGGITGFQQHYADTIRSFELRFDHSFFSVWKVFSPGSPSTLSHTYYAVCAIMFTALFFARVVRLAWPNRLLFLTVCMVLLPPVSYEYTLVHLYVPVLLWLTIAATSKLSATGVLVLAGLLVLLLPGNLLSLNARFQAGQVQAAILLLVAIGTSFPLTATEREQVSSSQKYVPA